MTAGLISRNIQISRQTYFYLQSGGGSENEAGAATCLEEGERALGSVQQTLGAGQKDHRYSAEKVQSLWDQEQVNSMINL